MLIVLGREYDYFYNPMWNFLGDKNSVPGTYYYAKSIHYNEPWNTFDQVLIRPQLLDNFVYSDLKILTRIKNKELYNHKTNKLFISDHLPILININL